MTEQEIKEAIFGEDQSLGENGTAGKVSTNDGNITGNVEKPSPDELLRKAFGLAG